MEMTVWNCLEQSLATVDVEFIEENTTWFEECTDERDIHKITDVDGGILISESGYTYPVWIDGASRAGIAYSRDKALELKRLHSLNS
jgi:hypothetical protein